MKDAFERRYRAELETKTQLLEELIADAHGRDVTLVYASREQTYNNVMVLKEVLEELQARENER